MSNVRTELRAYRILVEARELLKNGWCKGSWARDKAGREVSPNSKDACEFCFRGALQRASGRAEAAHSLALSVAEDTLAEEYRWLGGVIAWNDRAVRKKDQVLLLMERSLERQRKRLEARGVGVD